MKLASILLLMSLNAYADNTIAPSNVSVFSAESGIVATWDSPKGARCNDLAEAFAFKKAYIQCVASGYSRCIQVNSNVATFYTDNYNSGCKGTVTVQGDK